MNGKGLLLKNWCEIIFYTISERIITGGLVWLVSIGCIQVVILYECCSHKWCIGKEYRGAWWTRLICTSGSTSGSSCFCIFFFVHLNWFLCCCTYTINGCWACWHHWSWTRCPWWSLQVKWPLTKVRPKTFFFSRNLVGGFILLGVSILFMFEVRSENDKLWFKPHFSVLSRFRLSAILWTRWEYFLQKCSTK